MAEANRTVKYVVSVKVDLIHLDIENAHLNVELDGPLLGPVFESDDFIVASRVARFLAGSAMRLPPIDATRSMDEEIIETL